MRTLLCWLIVAVFTLFSWLPLRIHYVLSDFMYFLLYKVFRYRLPVVVTNISRAFPEADYKDIKRYTKDFYRSLCDTVVEVVWAFTRSRETVGRMLDFIGVDILNRAYADGKNVLVVMGHQSNWELFTALPDVRSRYGFKVDNKHFFFIYKKMSSKLSDHVLKKIRTGHDACVFVEKNNVARMLLKNNGEGGTYYFLADQYPDKGAGVDMEFLNQKTRVYNGPELLARKLSLPVVFVSVERVSRGHYLATYHPICDNASEVEAGFVTNEYVRLLEESINRDKSNWLWSHRRWKNKK